MAVPAADRRLGASYRDQQPVLAVIGSHLLATLELMATAILIAILVGVWIASWGDPALLDRRHPGHVGAMVALSIPTFCSGWW